MLQRLLAVVPLAAPLLCVLWVAGSLHAQEADDAPAEVTTQTHWFQVDRSEQMAGVLKVELSREANSWIFRETWILFEREQEILIQGESRFEGEGETLRPTSLSISVSAGDQTWLTGALRFTPKGVLESFRHWDGEQLAPVVERQHPKTEQPWITPATLPFLGPEIAKDGASIPVVFPAVPRGLRGPVIGGTQAEYLLVRKGNSIRIRGDKAVHGRTAELEWVDGQCEKVELGPSLRLTRSDRATCLGWHRKRGKGVDPGSDDPTAPPPKPLGG